VLLGEPELPVQKPVLRSEVVVQNHGDRKEQAELELVVGAPLSGAVVV